MRGLVHSTQDITQPGAVTAAGEDFSAGEITEMVATFNPNYLSSGNVIAEFYNSEGEVLVRKNAGGVGTNAPTNLFFGFGNIEAGSAGSVVMSAQYDWRTFRMRTGT